MRKIESAADRELFAAERPGGSGIESIMRDPSDPSRFDFMSLGKGDRFYRMEFHATCIGNAVPEAALVFPDTERLKHDIDVTELDAGAPTDIARFVLSGRAWAMKFALSQGSEEMASSFAKGSPVLSWEEIRRRDQELGGKYRAALARQGIAFKRVMKAPAATQPTTRAASKSG